MSNNFYDNDGRIVLKPIAGKRNYGYDFPVNDQDDLEVWHKGSKVAIQSATVGEKGGVVTLVSAIQDLSSPITITRMIPANRLTEFRQDGYITANLLNTEFDNIYNILGQTQHEVERNTIFERGATNSASYTFPIGFPNMVMGWNAKGDALEGKSIDDIGGAHKEHTHTVSDVTGLEDRLVDKVDVSRVKTDVPAEAKFTDTVYEHPPTHSIDEISRLQEVLDNKVPKDMVLSRVPANAQFTDTDTIYEHPPRHTIDEVEGLPLELSSRNNPTIIDNLQSRSIREPLSANQGRVLLEAIKEVITASGISAIDDLTSTDIINALSANKGRVLKEALDALMNAHTTLDERVKSDVPVNAKFTDTTYNHPATHSADMITPNSSRRFVSDADIGHWNNKSDGGHKHTPESIGAAPAIHGHTPESVGAAAKSHSHTLESLDAASVNHSHTPESIGAEPKLSADRKGRVAYGVGNPPTTIGFSDGDLYIKYT